MEEWICRQNIERLRRRVEELPDGRDQKVLLQVLKEEIEKLDGLARRRQPGSR